MTSPAEGTQKPEFSTDSYMVEILALRGLVLQIKDDAIRDSIQQRIFAMNDMLRPVVEEYLATHPEADKRAPITSATDLYRMPGGSMGPAV